MSAPARPDANAEFAIVGRVRKAHGIRAELDEGDVYVHGLIGMHVRLESGDALGDGVAVYELPQGLAIDVKRVERGDTVLLLYEHSVLAADRESRTLTVTVPDGLLD